MCYKFGRKSEKIKKFDLTGGAAARGGRFFKEKAPQKPFWEKVFCRPMGGVRTWSAHAGGGAPSICRRQRPSAVGVSFLGPIFLWAERKQSQ